MSSDQNTHIAIKIFGYKHFDDLIAGDFNDTVGESKEKNVFNFHHNLCVKMTASFNLLKGFSSSVRKPSISLKIMFPDPDPPGQGGR